MTTHLRRYEPTLRRAATAALALGLSLLLAALPALATEVVQVRVGRHPEFTRVVFELDAPARYRVEKREGANPELVVTIDAASSAARTIRSQSEGIKGVDVRSEGRTTVARVALRKPGLRLKEMILANPSRIVLDLMNDRPVAVAKAPAPEPRPKPEPVTSEPKPAPEPVAKQPEPAPAPVAKTPTPAPKPEPVTPEPKPAPAPIAKTPVAPPTPEPAPAPVAPPEPAPEVVAKAPEPAPEPAALPAPAPKPVPPVAKTPTPKPQPVAKPGPAAKPARPESAASGPPIEILAGAAVGILLCVAGLFVLLRRRRPGRDAADELAGDDGDAEQRSFTEMVFSESGGDSAASAGGSVSDLDSFFDDGDADGTPGSRGGKTMNQGLSDLPTDRGATRMPAGMRASTSSGPDPDVLRVVHELERRMGQLEGKLGESNEARERLERQVAAQSEELRVQRAAIARTQRALRSLSRGDDDKATEPALRDDETQAKTRINV